MQEALERRERLTEITGRRSLHFIPVPLLENLSPESLQALDADVVVFDLEDSVRQEDKEKARFYLLNSLEYYQDSINGQISVRINPLSTQTGRGDLEVFKGRATLMLPKIRSLYELVVASCSRKIIPIIETPESLRFSKQMLIQFSQQIDAVVFGKEDLLAELALVNPDPNSVNPLPSPDLRHNPILRQAFLYLVQQVHEGAWPKDVQVIDGVTRKLGGDQTVEFYDLLDEALFAKRLGATGKLSVHPQQIEAINKAFVNNRHYYEWPLVTDLDFSQNFAEIPNLKPKLANAKGIIKVFEENPRPQNATTIVIDGETVMIGPPMYKLCLNILEKAKGITN